MAEKKEKAVEKKVVVDDAAVAITAELQKKYAAEYAGFKIGINNIPGTINFRVHVYHIEEQKASDLKIRVQKEKKSFFIAARKGEDGKLEVVDRTGIRNPAPLKELLTPKAAPSVFADKPEKKEELLAATADET